MTLNTRTQAIPAKSFLVLLMALLCLTMAINGLQVHNSLACHAGNQMNALVAVSDKEMDQRQHRPMNMSVKRSVEAWQKALSAWR